MPAALEIRPSGSELAARSWKSLRQAFKAMPVFYVGMFLAYGLPMVGLDLVVAYPGQVAILLHGLVRPNTAFFLSAIVLQTGLSLVVIAIAAVATHRFILLDDNHPKVGRISSHFFFWLVFVEVILIFLALVKFLDRKIMPDSGFMVEINWVISVLGFAVVVYSALVFPAVAVDEPVLSWKDRIDTSWKRMDGNFWLFLRADILALWPLALTLVLILLLTALLLQPGKTEYWEAWGLIEAAIGDLVRFPILMVHAAIASWLYAWVRRDASQISSSGASG